MGRVKEVGHAFEPDSVVTGNDDFQARSMIQPVRLRAFSSGVARMPHRCR
jgi:hypothetical protein